MFFGKQNLSPDNVFLFETLHTTPMRHISLTQAVILSSTSNFFASIAVLCNKMCLQILHYSLQRTSWETRSFYSGFKSSLLLRL